MNRPTKNATHALLSMASGLLLVLLSHSGARSASFLTSGIMIHPQKALLYAPCSFDVHNYDELDSLNDIIDLRWGEGEAFIFLDPISEEYPGDNPETTVAEFRQLLHSGDYGLIVAISHGCIHDEPPIVYHYLIEPYCRSEATVESEAISRHLAMLAWYRYTGEDFADPEVMCADYDMDGTPLCGDNDRVEHWIDEYGQLQGPPAGLPASDDDLDDLALAAYDNNEDGDTEDPGESEDLWDDNAPGMRGDQQLGTGDGEDGEFDLDELTVGTESMPGERNGLQYYAVAVTSEFFSNPDHVAESSSAVFYACGCMSSFIMKDACRNGPMQVPSFLGYQYIVNADLVALPDLIAFFTSMAKMPSDPGTPSWNRTVGEAHELIAGPRELLEQVELSTEDPCSAGMVLYCGDVYIAITPRPYPTHGPVGSIANPHVISAATPAAYTIQQAMNSGGPGTVVHLEQGIYPIATPLQVPDGLTIQGSGPHQTTLLATGNGCIFHHPRLSPLSHITTIQGFHLLNGAPAIKVGDELALGIECPLLVRNNVFTWTDAPGIGVAVYSATNTSWRYGLEGSAPLIFNNVFYSMASNQYFVGVRTLASCTEISHNTFVFMGPGSQTSGIEALWTGDLILSDPRIHNNVFVGSGLYRDNASRPMMKQNTFWEAGVGNWYWDSQGHPTPEPTFGWHIDNDINVDPMHVVGPMAAHIGGAGSYYLDPMSPACGRADDSPAAEFHRRLTTRVDQQPAGPFAVRADRGCYYMIDCSGLPTFTPGTPTSTPGGPTATPTATLTSTPVPTGSPTSTPITGAYTEGFESGAPGWQVQGLWHLTASDAHDGATCAWYGQELPLGHYDTGGSNAGSLTSPLIQLAAGAGLQLWSKEETEGSWDFDLRLILVSTDAGATWEELARLQGDLRGWYEPTQVDLSEYADLTVQLRLEFDTVDELFNGFLGWLVDDVYIGWLPTPIPTRTPTPSRTPTPWTVTMTPTRTPTIYVMPPLPSMDSAGTVLLLAVLGVLTAFSQARRVRKAR